MMVHQKTQSKIERLNCHDRDEPVWLQIGYLYDGESPSRPDAHLVYDAQGIQYVGDMMQPPSAEHLRPGQDEPDVILPDHAVLPGLIDGHTHIFLEGAELDLERRKASQSQAANDLLRHAEARCRKLVALGIIAMRDGGDKDGVGLALCEQKGRDVAAEVFSPGPGINRVKRYGSFFCEPFEDFTTGEEVVADRVARGADHIKVVPTGIINFAKAAVVSEPQYTVEELQSVTDAAHARGKHVMAHASGDVGIEVAIEGGVDTIEHGFFVRDDQLQRMADRAITWVPTFAPVQKQVDHADAMGWSDLERDNLQRILDQHAMALQTALRMGVRILVGSDAGSCGVPHADGLLEEMELLERAGMPSLQVLNATTAGNAKHLLPGAVYGKLAVDCRSRFILIQADPGVTVKNLQLRRAAIFDGRLYLSENADTSGL